MKWMKWGLAGAAALLAGGALTFAVLAVGGTAAAQGDPGENRSRFLELLAAKLGVSVEQLKSASAEARNQLVEELLASGAITQAQAAKIENSNPGPGFGLHSGGPGGIGAHGIKMAVNIAEVTARLSNVTVEVVRLELQQGKSFAQIAAEHGVSREALKNAIVAEHTAAIQAKVASGDLTQAQASQIVAGFSSHVDQIIDKTGFGAGGPGGAEHRIRPGVRPSRTP